jgi:hypothetical protein
MPVLLPVMRTVFPDRSASGLFMWQDSLTALPIILKVEALYGGIAMEAMVSESYN